jgi:hypothetical protein
MNLMGRILKGLAVGTIAYMMDSVQMGYYLIYTQEIIMIFENTNGPLG